MTFYVAIWFMLVVMSPVLARHYLLLSCWAFLIILTLYKFHLYTSYVVWLSLIRFPAVVKSQTDAMGFFQMLSDVGATEFLPTFNTLSVHVPGTKHLLIRQT
jgi:hypothetical protein